MESGLIFPGKQIDMFNKTFRNSFLSISKYFFGSVETRYVLHEIRVEETASPFVNKGMLSNKFEWNAKQRRRKFSVNSCDLKNERRWNKAIIRETRIPRPWYENYVCDSKPTIRERILIGHDVENFYTEY